MNKVIKFGIGDIVHITKKEHGPYKDLVGMIVDTKVSYFNEPYYGIRIKWISDGWYTTYTPHEVLEHIKCRAWIYYPVK